MSVKTKMKTAGLAILVLTLVVFAVGNSTAANMESSVFEQELQKVKYNFSAGSYDNQYLAQVDEDEDMPLSEIAQAQATPPDYKSPGRAFLYSLAVPGLGQYYYGSKIKPVAFLAIEVLGLMQAFKYHGDGSDLEGEYEAFNNLHWSEGTYTDYLDLAYGTTVWDSLQDDSGITHRLPDTKTQQYYEMTGKYDQFAWGWDDSELDGETFLDKQNAGYIDKITGPAYTPTSVNRESYEVMRDDANDQFDKSMKFVFLVMANHLVSAFEAYFVTKSHNKNLRYEQEFARLKVKPQLRSYHSWKDTPYVSLSYKF